VPTEEDIVNARQLAERLKGETYTETLNNILEWQERNITYWKERGYLDSLLRLFIMLGLFFTFIWISIPILIFIYLLLVLLTIPSLISLIVSFIVFLLLFWFLMKASVPTKLAYLILMSYPLYEIIKAVILARQTPENVSMLLNLSIINWAIFGVSLFTICYLFIVYKPFARQETGLGGKLRKIWELIILTFKLSLPVSKILEYRLGVCRDYARLTAALLVSLYPNSRIYFFTFMGHVAAGIKIGDKVYVLDQKLPILKPESWLIRWDKREAKVLELIRRDSKVLVKLVGKISRKQYVRITKDFREMFKELVKEVNKAIREGKNSVTFTLEKAALLFNIGDSIIKDSLLRKVELTLQREFVSKASKIGSIDIIKRNNDLLFRINLVD